MAWIPSKDSLSLDAKWKAKKKRILVYYLGTCPKVWRNPPSLFWFSQTKQRDNHLTSAPNKMWKGKIMRITLYFFIFFMSRAGKQCLQNADSDCRYFQMKDYLFPNDTSQWNACTYIYQKTPFSEVKLPLSNSVTAGFPFWMVRSYQIACSCRLKPAYMCLFFPPRQAVS